MTLKDYYIIIANVINNIIANDIIYFQNLECSEWPAAYESERIVGTKSKSFNE